VAAKLSTRTNGVVECAFRMRIPWLKPQAVGNA
jgi:hypothetical protein